MKRPARALTDDERPERPAHPPDGQHENGLDGQRHADRDEQRTPQLVERDGVVDEADEHEGDRQQRRRQADEDGRHSIAPAHAATSAEGCARRAASQSDTEPASRAVELVQTFGSPSITPIGTSQARSVRAP